MHLAQSNHQLLLMMGREKLHLDDEVAILLSLLADMEQTSVLEQVYRAVTDRLAVKLGESDFGVYITENEDRIERMMEINEAAIQDIAIGDLFTEPFPTIKVTKPRANPIGFAPPKRSDE